MNNKIKLLVLLIFIFLFMVGCSSNDNTDTSVSKNESYKGEGVLKCTREATAKEGIDVELNYEVYYNDNYIEVLHSIEKVISNSSDDLDEYEQAYTNIYKNYEDLKYYDNIITRDENSVTSDTTINYEKIDIDRLLEIEGEEDNVIENGKVKVETWVNFAEQFGATCEEAN